MRGSEKRGSVSGDRDGKVVLCWKRSVVPFGGKKKRQRNNGLRDDKHWAMNENCCGNYEEKKGLRELSFSIILKQKSNPHFQNSTRSQTPKSELRFLAICRPMEMFAQSNELRHFLLNNSHQALTARRPTATCTRLKLWKGPPLPSYHSFKRRATYSSLSFSEQWKEALSVPRGALDKHRQLVALLCNSS